MLYRRNPSPRVKLCAGNMYSRSDVPNASNVGMGGTSTQAKIGSIQYALRVESRRLKGERGYSGVSNNNV